MLEKSPYAKKTDRVGGDMMTALGVQAEGEKTLRKAFGPRFKKFWAKPARRSRKSEMARSYGCVVKPEC
jgi:hypothetical protein